MIVSGGTHKTLPGPSSGLILTNDADLASLIDAELSPKFVRHSHPHHIAALAAALIEHRAFGAACSDRIRAFAQRLSASLETRGVEVIQDGGRRTETHQIFIHVPAETLDEVTARAAAAGLTLNAKRKPLFRGTGLRLGVQELARYQWSLEFLDRLADVIVGVVGRHRSTSELKREVLELAQANRFEPSLCLPAPETTDDVLASITGGR